MKATLSALLLAVHFLAFAQDEAVVIVVPSLESKILVDGIEKGVSKSGNAIRIITTGGEHYIEAQPLDNRFLTKGEAITLEVGKQKILKIQFDTPVAAEPNPITVADLNISVPGEVTVITWASENEGAYPYPLQLFAFEEGDEIVVDATMSNRNGTNVLRVFTYPDRVERYTNNAFTELKDLRIKVGKRGIYVFELRSNHAFDRDCFLKIRRKPASTHTIDFNPTVSLKKIYTPVAIHEVQDFFINGGLNASFMGGKSRVTIPIKLPKNTTEWYYRFSASRDPQDIENVKNNFKLIAELTTTLLGLSGTGTIVTEGIFNALAQPPGADYCDVYLLTNESRGNFESKDDGNWRFFPDATRQNFKSGNVRVTCCSQGQFYLGIKNPSSTNGISVSIEVVALTVTEDYVMEQSNK